MTAPTESGDELVRMYHPETGGVGTATRRALDELWRYNGWELQSEAAATATDVLRRPIGELESLTVPELREVLDARGVAYTSADNKPDLVARLDPVADTATKTDEIAELFDPNQHTVTEVAAYLKSTTESGDQDELDRVRELERNGQARKGILGEGN